MSNDIHAGHRERIRAQYAKTGGEGFLDHQYLELLLTYAIPRRDTNELAHTLLARFGSLEKLFCADIRELMRIPGVGEGVAVFLRMQGDLHNRLLLGKLRNTRGQILLNTPCAAANYAYIALHALPTETVRLACLNSKRVVIHAETLQTGTLTEARVYPRSIAEIALLRHAHSVILMHNHPSGDPAPSAEDAATTDAVRAALAGIDIQLADHIVIGGTFAFSFAADALLDLSVDPPVTLSLSEYAAYQARPQPALQKVMEAY